MDENVPTGDVFRVDLATGKWERFQPLKSLANGKRNTIYQLISDSKNNAWVAEFVNGYLGRIDAKTTQVTWFQLPTQNARARRMRIDDQDRIWVTEYRGNKVAMFDPKTEKFTEYPLPPHTYPYRAAIDRNGEIWTVACTPTASCATTQTNRTVEYPLPRTANIRSVWLDADPAGLLDRQQPRRCPRQGGSARLNRSECCARPIDGAGVLGKCANLGKGQRGDPPTLSSLWRSPWTARGESDGSFA